MKDNIKTFEELAEALKKLDKICNFTSNDVKQCFFRVKYENYSHCDYSISGNRLFLKYSEPLTVVSKGGSVQTIHNISINSTRASLNGLYKMVKAIVECEDDR